MQQRPFPRIAIEYTKQELFNLVAEARALEAVSWLKGKGVDVSAFETQIVDLSKMKERQPNGKDFTAEEVDYVMSQSSKYWRLLLKAIREYFNES